MVREAATYLVPYILFTDCYSAINASCDREIVVLQRRYRQPAELVSYRDKEKVRRKSDNGLYAAL
jgi:hypothetical protein